jgi:hypothetical protein
VVAQQGRCPLDDLLLADHGPPPRLAVGSEQSPFLGEWPAWEREKQSKRRRRSQAVEIANGGR